MRCALRMNGKNGVLTKIIKNAFAVLGITATLAVGGIYLWSTAYQAGSDRMENAVLALCSQGVIIEDVTTGNLYVCKPTSNPNERSL